MATKGIKRKTVVTDPEGNTIITKTRLTNLFGQKGSTKKIIKYADPVSSGKKREVQYTNAPVPTDEQLGIESKGGATKMKKYAMGGAKIKKMGSGGMHMMADGTPMKDSMMKKGGAKKTVKKPVKKAMYGTAMTSMKKGGAKKK
jgi:hypothetical protein